MSLKIYYIPGSHPCNAVMQAARLKGIPFKKVVIVPPSQRLLMTLMFGAGTVPAMKLEDGEKVQGSERIMHSLDSMAPSPLMFPLDAASRERVTAAVRWGNGDFQDMGRRLVWASIKRSPAAMETYTKEDKILLPRFVQRMSAPLMARWVGALNKATDEQVEKDLRELPKMLDRVDQYIADGVIGGDAPNAADLLLCATLALWMTMDDLRPTIEARPCGQLTRRLFGEVPGHVRAGVLPAGWLEPLGAAAEVAV